MDRGLTLLIATTIAAACSRSPEPSRAAPSASVGPAVASSSRPAAAASAEDRCGDLGGRIAAAIEAAAKTQVSCKANSDCECFGGPVCPNPLATLCPDAVAKSQLKVVKPLVNEWVLRQCGGFVWSPFGCEARCLQGRCQNRFR